MISELLIKRLPIAAISSLGLCWLCECTKIDTSTYDYVMYEPKIVSVKEYEIKAVPRSSFNSSLWKDAGVYYGPENQIFEKDNFAFRLSFKVERLPESGKEHFDNVHKKQMQELKEAFMNNAAQRIQYRLSAPAYFDYQLSAPFTVKSDCEIGGRASGLDLSDLIVIIYASDGDRVICSYPDFKWIKNIYEPCPVSDYFSEGKALVCPRSLVLAFRDGIDLPDQFTLFLKAELNSDIHKSTVWETELKWGYE